MADWDKTASMTGRIKLILDGIVVIEAIIFIYPHTDTQHNIEASELLRRARRLLAGLAIIVFSSPPLVELTGHRPTDQSFLSRPESF